MKILRKLFCLLLVICMLTAVGCNGTESQSSEPDGSTNEDSVNENTNTESTVPEEPAPQASTEYTTKIDELQSGVSDRSLNHKNLLQGLKYTASIAADAGYPDNGTLLTNGVMPDSFNTESTWAGYILTKANPTLTLDLDMGAVKGGLLDFTVSALDFVQYGIFAPESVKVYIAGEDKEYTLIGTAYRPRETLSQNSSYSFSVLLGKAVEARYIRFEITSEDRNSGWCFIGEVMAVSYSEEHVIEATSGDLNEYYQYTGVPQIDTPEYWSEDEEDYNETINLLSGRTAFISAADAVDSTLITDWYNSRATGIMTNGRTASTPSYNDSSWFHITHGGSRSIVFDLKKTSAVSGFTAGFLLDTTAGVKFPWKIAVSLSENGVDWQTVYNQDKITSTEEAAIERLEVSFDKEYKARYFRLSFNVNTHTYIDEVTATGSKNISGAAELEPDENSGENGDKGYIMPEDFCGVNNMLLSYHCYTDANNKSEETGLITAEEYLPYVAYLDEDGNIKDTFFDSFLYLPYVRFIHNGDTSDYGRSAEGWKTYVDDMFYEDRNVNALDQCAETVYNALGITDEKLKVFGSILYTFPNLYNGSKNNFGDIDGDGVDEDFANVEDRKTAIKWIMDEELNRFNEGNYENLEFCGFYWFEESIDYYDPHELELISFAVEYAHQLGCKIFWIPYQTAAGVDEWEYFGFDLACLQPNYMFNANFTSDVLYSTAKKTERLGMCVEIEINDPTNRSEAARYVEYLIAGAETGYMEAVKMYYQVGVPGAFHTACYSKDAAVRKLYDDTYLFAKEKFELISPEETIISEVPLEFEYTPNESYSGAIDISKFAEFSGTLIITQSPKYGSVKLNADGTFIYYPTENYCGEDEFMIAYDMGYGDPIPTVIKMKSK